MASEGLGARAAYDANLDLTVRILLYSVHYYSSTHYALHHDTSFSIVIYSYVCQKHRAIATYCLKRKYFQAQTSQTQLRKTLATSHSYDALIIDALIAGRRFLPRHINQ